MNPHPPIDRRAPAAPALERAGRRRTSSTRGFTLIETLIVLALMGILAMFGLPAFFDTLRRERLVGSARQTATLMRLARATAVKVNRPSGVTIDFDKNEVIAFTDSDADGTFNAGDKVLSRFTLPAGIACYGPADTYGSGVHTGGSVDLAENAEGEGTVMFTGVGGARETGAFRFADSSGNYLEARVEPQATGRVGIQKYEGAGDDDPNFWWEQGEDGHEWTWGG